MLRGMAVRREREQQVCVTTRANEAVRGCARVCEDERCIEDGR